MAMDYLKLTSTQFFSVSASTSTGYGKCSLCIILHDIYTVAERINIISTAYITSSFVV